MTLKKWNLSEWHLSEFDSGKWYFKSMSFHSCMTVIQMIVILICVILFSALLFYKMSLFWLPFSKKGFCLVPFFGLFFCRVSFFKVSLYRMSWRRFRFKALLKNQLRGWRKMFTVVTDTIKTFNGCSKLVCSPLTISNVFLHGNKSFKGLHLGRLRPCLQTIWNVILCQWQTL